MRDLSWLFAHHPPSERDRCFQFRGIRFCRRCTVLYPFTVLVLILQFTSLRFSPFVRPWIFLSALPATLEFMLERLDLIAYSPRRVLGVTMLLAVALGTGFAEYLRNPFSLPFWAMVFTCGIPATLTALFREWVDARTRF